MKKVGVYHYSKLLILIFAFGLGLLTSRMTSAKAQLSPTLWAKKPSPPLAIVSNFPSEEEETCVVKLLNEAGVGFGYGYAPGTQFTELTHMVITEIPVSNG